MGNTLKKGADNLKKLAGKEDIVEQHAQSDKEQKAHNDGVLIGAIFPPIVRRSFAQLQADPRNDGKTMKDLIAEAYNDLFAKYNLPQTAQVEHKSRRRK